MQHSNRYIFIYSILMVVIIAVTLTVVAIQLKPAQEDNIRIEKMQNILASVNVPISEIPKKKVIEEYNNYIKTAFGVNNSGEIVEEDANKVFSIELANEIKKTPENQILPVFVAILDKGDTAFVVPLKGKGLWGSIWGYISFKTDCNTVVGTIFDHKSETPGLGAEINTRAFQAQFLGKKIFDEQGKFISIAVVKGGTAPDNQHGVDAISGGTITSKGVEKMLFDNLSSYEAFFKKHIQL